MNVSPAAKSLHQPWYRYPLVWMLIAIPASAVLVCSVIIVLAVSTNDGLVVDDYYAQGLAINQVIARDRRAATDKISARLSVLPEQRLLKLNFDKGLLAEYPDTLQLMLRHATRSDHDVVLELLHGQTDQYIAHLPAALPAGFWHLELGNEDWRLTARSQLDAVTQINLVSAELPD